MPNNLHQKPSTRETGQSVIIIAAAFIGLLAFIGLAIDFGILLIGMSHLKRGVDAAALAAAAQYRDGVASAALSDSANEFLRFNGVDLENINTTAQTCDDLPGDQALCTTPRRKLVRITARAEVSFVFLPIIGIKTLTISESSIAEAASLDVVLVIDISESMTYDAPPGTSQGDPSICNDRVNHPLLYCEPFQDVKKAAIKFVKNVLNKPANQDEDRISIVIFSNGWEAGQYATQVVGIPDGSGGFSGWTSDFSKAKEVLCGTGSTINPMTGEENCDGVGGLSVYTPPRCDDPNFTGANPPDTTMPGLCRTYDSGIVSMNCPWAWPEELGGKNDASTCSTTNIGGGLQLAGQMFSDSRRSDALWVTILLTDGSANATSLDPDPSRGDNIGLGIAQPALPDWSSANKVDINTMTASLPIGFCPSPTNNTSPFCKDNSVTSRHYLPADMIHYDADDFARDEALFVGCDPNAPASSCHNVHGQGAMIFTIGLGEQVLARDVNNMAYGDSLLRYIAAVGDDGDPATDPCNGVSVPTLPLLANPDHSYTCGNYYFAQYSGILDNVFTDIFSRIYTRITQ